uniref:Serine and arginine rich splicing factor 6b n=1 Tax=Callorhinchus milii TaxID=7868 RepID=A0A4W3J6V6_CALMI
MPRVYVGRLSYQVRERDLERFFRGYGKLLEVDLKNGYGFVEFEDSRDADDAVYELNGKELCGERVIVEHARGPRRDGSYGGGGGYGSGRSGYGYRRSGREKYGPPVRTEFRLIVENLSSRCSWQDLKDFMRQAGEVTYADAHKQHMNEGVIEFRSYSDMKRALDKLDGSEINGRKIRLVEDRPRNSRRSSSGSRSRSKFDIFWVVPHRCEAPDENSVRPILWTTDKSAAGQSSKSRSRSKDHSRSKSKSQERKSRSRSISKAKSDKRSRSRSPSRSKSALNNKSHSRSPSPKVNGKGDAKSVSRSRSKSRSRSRNKSTSPVKTKPKSENRSRSRSRSVSRSRSRSKD